MSAPRGTREASALLPASVQCYALPAPTNPWRGLGFRGLGFRVEGLGFWRGLGFAAEGSGAQEGFFKLRNVQSTLPVVYQHQIWCLPFQYTRVTSVLVQAAIIKNPKP